MSILHVVAIAWLGLMPPAVAVDSVAVRDAVMGVDAAGWVTHMESSFNKLTDYQCRIDARIVNGSERMHVKGRFAFRTPRQVLFTMGVKGGVVFRKDGRIRGWFLTRAFAHEHHPDDRILRDVRGRRLDQFVMGDLIAEMKSLVQRGGSISVVTAEPPNRDQVLLELVASGTGAGFSRRLYWIDTNRVLPVRFQTFDGRSLVEDVRCDGLEVNVGLDQRLFE